MPKKKKEEEKIEEIGDFMTACEELAIERSINLAQTFCVHRNYWKSKDDAQKYISDRLKTLIKSVDDEKINPLNYIRIAAQMAVAKMWINAGTMDGEVFEIYHHSKTGNAVVQCKICNKPFYDREHFEDNFLGKENDYEFANNKL